MKRIREVFVEEPLEYFKALFLNKITRIIFIAYVIIATIIMNEIINTGIQDGWISVVLTIATTMVSITIYIILMKQQNEREVSPKEYENLLK